MRRFGLCWSHRGGLCVALTNRRGSVNNHLLASDKLGRRKLRTPQTKDSKNQVRDRNDRQRDTQLDNRKLSPSFAQLLRLEAHGNSHSGLYVDQVSPRAALDRNKAPLSPILQRGSGQRVVTDLHCARRPCRTGATDVCRDSRHRYSTAAYLLTGSTHQTHVIAWQHLVRKDKTWLQRSAS